MREWKNNKKNLTEKKSREKSFRFAKHVFGLKQNSRRILIISSSN
jgi:hypothetical protein